MNSPGRATGGSGARAETVVLLLRGVNVGGASKLPMADLRRIAQELGATAVRTHLNSGNLICSWPGSPQDAAALLAEALGTFAGRAVPVVARRPAELAAVLALDPFAGQAENLSRYSVSFFSAEPEPEAIARAVEQGERVRRADLGERWHLAAREMYLLIPQGIHESKVPQAFSDARLGVTVTNRNWNTVRALVELSAGE